MGNWWWVTGWTGMGWKDGWGLDGRRKVLNQFDRSYR